MHILRDAGTACVVLVGMVAALGSPVCLTARAEQARLGPLATTDLETFINLSGDQAMAADDRESLWIPGGPLVTPARRLDDPADAYLHVLPELPKGTRAASRSARKPSPSPTPQGPQPSTASSAAARTTKNARAVTEARAQSAPPYGPTSGIASSERNLPVLVYFYQVPAPVVLVACAVVLAVLLGLVFAVRRRRSRSVPAAALLLQMPQMATPQPSGRSAAKEAGGPAASSPASQPRRRAA